MGKRRLLLLSVMLSMVFVFIMPVRNASAIESLTVGLKYWYPQWELSGYSSFDTIKWDTKFGMVGPTASLILSDHFAVSASFFTGQFEKNFDEVYYGYDPATAKWTSTRSDLDAIFAWIINPYFNVFGGVKYLAYDQKIDGEYWVGGTWDLKYNLAASGVGLGVGGNLPLGSSPFTLYGTLSYSYLSGTFKLSGSQTYDDKATITYPIISLETGLRYAMEKIPLVFMGSVRYQKSSIDVGSFDYSEGIGTSLDETFWGLILFAGYRFNFEK